MTLPSSVNEIVAGIAPISADWRTRAEARTAELAIPPRALGRLHHLAEQMCAIQRSLTPAIDRKTVLVLAGDHGVARKAVSAFPQEVTMAMVQAFLVGGGGINAIARHVGADVYVADMGIISEIDHAACTNNGHLLISKIAAGTDDISEGPAMTRANAELALLTGFAHATRLINGGCDVLGTGDMGIANTTPSAAIGAAIVGTGLEEMVGRGTGLDDEGLAHKKAVIAQALEVNQPDAQDGVDVLAKVGGFEIGGIAGLILACAFHRKPVVVDGFISTAGALIAAALCPAAQGYMFAGHCSEEPGHKLMLAHLGLAPILDLGMRLGEGTGGAMAMSVIEGALKVFKEVMTLEEAGVTSN
ncbi:MAG: nicotinate-nucleotide--dimethylbenzimidazole phosphoribosyltransferase [Desulfosarcinaceae bacterium]|nr:nicotinate-nucleotide--dimethylbenzimidazole phosphoribosyltransferase [Desulfosarcinaceae bacterium]